MRGFFGGGGRYGGDALNSTLIVGAFVFLVAAQRSGIELLLIPAYAAVVIAGIRMFSRNIFKRQSENAAFLRMLGRVGGFFKNKFNELKQRRTHKFYKCPKCRAKLRLPRGKGKIVITCPKCRNAFDAKT